MSDPTTTPWALIVPARCWSCDAESEPRNVQVTPTGWGKIYDRAGYHYYLCPACIPDPSSAPSEAGAQEADCPFSEKQLEERVRVLEEAAEDLLKNQLSSSTGGDRGMIFDEYDAMVEARRKGTVTFDRSAVDRFRKALSGGGEQQ